MRKTKQRPRRGAGEWQRILTEQSNSGKSVLEYCTKKGLCVTNFYAWRKKLGEKVPGRRLEESFVEVVVPEIGGLRVTQESVRITTPGGYQVDVVQGTTDGFLKNILTTLGSV